MMKKETEAKGRSKEDWEAIANDWVALGADWTMVGEDIRRILTKLPDLTKMPDPREAAAAINYFGDLAEKRGKDDVRRS